MTNKIIYALAANHNNPGGARRRQEERVEARTSQEEPGGARRSQEEPGGAKESQEERSPGLLRELIALGYLFTNRCSQRFDLHHIIAK